MVAHPWIEATRGCVAIERGPLVYCIEQADHPGTRIADVEIDAAASLQSAWEPDSLDGVAVIRTLCVGEPGNRSDARVDPARGELTVKRWASAERGARYASATSVRTEPWLPKNRAQASACAARASASKSVRGRGSGSKCS